MTNETGKRSRDRSSGICPAPVGGRVRGIMVITILIEGQGIDPSLDPRSELSPSLLLSVVIVYDDAALLKPSGLIWRRSGSTPRRPRLCGVCRPSGTVGLTMALGTFESTFGGWSPADRP